MLHEVSLAEKSISWIDLFEIYRYTYMMYFMYIHTLSCKVMSSATGLHPGSRVLDKIWMPSADHTPEIMLAIITERIRSIIFALLHTTKTENAWWCVHKFWVGMFLFRNKRFKLDGILGFKISHILGIKKFIPMYLFLFQFSFHANKYYIVPHFETFHEVISSNKNILFLKSDVLLSLLLSLISKMLFR